MLRLALLASLLLAAPAALAQTGGSAEKVTWTVQASAAQRGQEARVVFRAVIEDGWRLYALNSQAGRPLEIDFESLPATLIPRTLRQSVPRSAVDEATGAPYTYFADQARIEQRLRVAQTAVRGGHLVSGAIRYAVCNDSICLMPASTPFRVRVQVR